MPIRTFNDTSLRFLPMKGKQLKHTFGKLMVLPAADKWLVFKVSIALPLVEGGLRLLGVQAVSRVLASGATTTTAPLTANSEVERQARLLSMVMRRHPFAGQCLSRSLTLWWSLRQTGIKSEVKLGMRKSGTQLLGHAWVEYEGQPIAESPDVSERYALLADAPLKKLPRSF